MARGCSSHGPSTASDARCSGCSDVGCSGCSTGGWFVAGQMARPSAPVGLEGANRAGSGGATPTPPAQMPTIASSSPPDKLTSDECKSIMASTKSFETSVRKLLKCISKMDKGKADLQVFAQDTTGTRYPAGIRTFRSAAEMVELDSTLSQCKKRDWVFMVTIPMGTSRRSALQKLHREHAMFVRSTDVEGWRNSSRHHVVWHGWRASGKNAPQPCAKRGLNVIATLRD